MIGETHMENKSLEYITEIGIEKEKEFYVIYGIVNRDKNE